MDPSASPPPSGPPYLPQTASLGGLPTVGLDVPITAVFLVLFITGAVTHMTILQLNRAKKHNFILSNLLFGFCMARITACIMRIVWANRPTNVAVAIAAQVFVAAGVVILFIVNLLFAQRIVRASHPRVGWSVYIHYGFLTLYVLVGLILVLLISFVVSNFYTLDPNFHRIAHDFILLGQTYFTTVAFLPIPIVAIALLAPRPTRLEKFGKGSWRTRVRVLLFAAAILTLGAGFRMGNSYAPARPLSAPAWFDSKACFYIFNFTIDISVVALYAIFRVDQRFHIPDGSKGPGDYVRGQKSATVDLEEGNGEEDDNPTVRNNSDNARTLVSESGDQLGEKEEEEVVAKPGERKWFS